MGLVGRGGWSVHTPSMRLSSRRTNVLALFPFSIPFSYRENSAIDVRLASRPMFPVKFCAGQFVKKKTDERIAVTHLSGVGTFHLRGLSPKTFFHSNLRLFSPASSSPRKQSVAPQIQIHTQRLLDENLLHNKKIAREEPPVCDRLAVQAAPVCLRSI